MWVRPSSARASSRWVWHCRRATVAGRSATTAVPVGTVRTRDRLVEGPYLRRHGGRRSERDRWVGRDVGREQLEAPTAGDRREQQRRLHHREGRADALARAHPERDEGTAREPLLEAV